MENIKKNKISGIEVIARGIILNDGKILLCKVKTKDNWFFPGGHLEAGETVREALKRELVEEINVEAVSAEFIGINENKFFFEGEEHQEINVMFKTEIKDCEVKCCEDHLEFSWFDLNNLEGMLILPEGLKRAVLDWIKDKKIFYCEQ
ncbi:MAG: 8-oxo-dGTP diphosphatase [Patescibacteria group bacterium]|nr:8-oxo-dGTP diphosphatase [Patescibacteria group bacterium]